MKNLAEKMVKIIAGVSGRVAKSGYNSHNKYSYVMEADLLDAVREEMLNNKVCIFSSVEESTTQEIGDKGNILTTVKMMHTFVDSESGDQFSVYTYGQGSDKLDKGVYKAITGANKYFLLKSFMLAGDDDPEKDTKDNKKHVAPSNVVTNKPKGPAFPAKSSTFKSSSPVGFTKKSSTFSPNAPKDDPKNDDIEF